jgi:Flp pilus assembly protein TadG
MFVPAVKTIQGARLGRGRRGAAATELAILLPFLALAFAVALDFCRAYQATQTIQTAAYAGAMYASGNTYAPMGTSLTDAAQQAALTEAVSLQPPLTSDQITVTITANTATVSISYNVPLLTQLLMGSTAVPVTRSVTMNLAPTGP